jgi:hypothetical protein
MIDEMPRSEEDEYLHDHNLHYEATTHQSRVFTQIYVAPEEYDVLSPPPESSMIERLRHTPQRIKRQTKLQKSEGTLEFED